MGSARRMSQIGLDSIVSEANYTIDKDELDFDKLIPLPKPKVEKRGTTPVSGASAHPFDLSFEHSHNLESLNLSDLDKVN